MIAFVLLIFLIFTTIYTYKKNHKNMGCNHNCENCIRVGNKN